jgi:hypothetical protein
MAMILGMSAGENVQPITRPRFCNSKNEGWILFGTLD